METVRGVFAVASRVKSQSLYVHTFFPVQRFTMHPEKKKTVGVGKPEKEVCVCVCACVRACVRACVCVCEFYLCERIDTSSSL